MPISKLSVVALLALTCAACASTDSQSRYQQELQQLETECRERGGTIRATGVSTGRPQTEYICRLTSASRITSG